MVLRSRHGTIRGLVLAGVVSAAGLLLAGCSKDDAATDRPSEPLPALPEPDLTALEAVVRNAITGARDAVAAKPDDADANGRLAMTYHANNFLEAAIVCYERAVRLQKKAFHWHYFLGHALMRSGDSKRALAAFQQAATLRPAYVPAIQVLADLHARAGDIEQARAFYERALEISPDCAPAHFGLGKIELANRNFAEAAVHLEAALETAPDAGRVRAELYKVYQAIEKTDQARELLRGRQPNSRAPTLVDPELQKVLALTTGSAAEYRRGQLALQRGAKRDALQHLANAVEANPDSAEYRLTLTTTMIGLGLYDEAKPHCIVLLQRHPADADVRYALAMMHAGRGERQRAITALRKCLELDPKRVSAMSSLAALLRERGDLDEARALLEQAVQTGPRYAEAHYNLGMLYRAMNRNDDAMRELVAAFQLEPDVAETRANLAELLELHGQPDAAIEHYQAALQANPRYEGPCARLGRLLWAKGEYRQALQTLQAGYKNVPSSVSIGRNLAWLLATCPDGAIRNGPEAIRIIEPLCGDDSCSDPILLEARAAAYAEVGRFEEAVTIAQRLVDLAAQAKSQQLYGQMVSRLHAYQQGQPYRMNR